MKAFLLSGNSDARLCPVTDSVPICMVPIRGVPLLAWWIRLFQKCGISEVLVNTHNFAEQVRDFIWENNSTNPRLTILEAYEEHPRGNAGIVRDNWDFVQKEESFLICNAENLCDIDLRRLCAFSMEKGSVMTMALTRVRNPRQCEIVEMDDASRITDFKEKPVHPRDNLAYAGIFVAGQELKQYLPDGLPLDMGRDVLPHLVGNMYGYVSNGYHRSILTLENLKRANEEWKHEYA